MELFKCRDCGRISEKVGYTGGGLRICLGCASNHVTAGDFYTMEYVDPAGGRLSLYREVPLFNDDLPGDVFAILRDRGFATPRERFTVELDFDEVHVKTIPAPETIFTFVRETEEVLYRGSFTSADR